MPLRKGRTYSGVLAAEYSMFRVGDDARKRGPKRERERERERTGQKI